MPSSPVVVVPMELPSTNTSTVDPGSAVPVNGGVVSVGVEPSAGVANTGAAGGAVSAGALTVKVLVLDSAEVKLPNLSVAEAWCGPVNSAVVGVKVKVSSLPTGTSVAMVVPSTVMVTVDPPTACR